MRIVQSLMLLFAFTGPIQSQENLKVLLIAGGHSYDTLAFNSVFEQMSDIAFEKYLQPAANVLIASGEAKKYDVILFYDSWQDISSQEIKGYEDLLQNGTGLVFLHHSLVSYQNWEGFKHIIGGKYRHPRYYSDSTLISDFKHDISMSISSNSGHPITKNFEPFEIFDEGYTNILVKQDVDVLLKTDHEYCNDVVGWAHEVHNSRVVYLLPGHGASGLTHPVYRQIIKNAILWTAGNL